MPKTKIAGTSPAGMPFCCVLICCLLACGPWSSLLLAESNDSLIVSGSEFCTGDRVEGRMLISAANQPDSVSLFLVATVQPGGSIAKQLYVHDFSVQREPFTIELPDAPLAEFFELRNQVVVGNRFEVFYRYEDRQGQPCESNRVPLIVNPRFQIKLTPATPNIVRCPGDESPLLFQFTTEIIPQTFADARIEYRLIFDGRTVTTNLQPELEVPVRVQPEPGRYQIEARALDFNCVEVAETFVEVSLGQRLAIEFLRGPENSYCEGDRVDLQLQNSLINIEAVEWYDTNDDVIIGQQDKLDFVIESLEFSALGDYSVRIKADGCWSESLPFELRLREETTIIQAEATRQLYCFGENVVIELQTEGTVIRSALLFDGRELTSLNPAATNRIEIANNGGLRSGEYVVQVTGPCNVAERSVNLVILPESRAELSSEPAGPSVELEVGADVEMQVLQAFPDESFQWLLDGRVLPNATEPFLTISNREGFQPGSYSVRVTMGTSQRECFQKILGPINVAFQTPAEALLRLAVPDTIFVSLGRAFSIPVEVVNQAEINPTLSAAELNFAFNIEMNATVAVPDAPLLNGSISDGLRSVAWSGSSPIPLQSELASAPFTAVLGDAAAADVVLQNIVLTAGGTRVASEPEVLKTVLVIEDIPFDGRGNTLLLNPLRLGLGLLLSPNPVTNGSELNIEVANLDVNTPANLQVFDVMGRLLIDLTEILEVEQTTFSVDLSQYPQLIPNRIYYIRLSQGPRNVTRMLTVAAQ